jgi:hypothetical protein
VTKFRFAALLRKLKACEEARVWAKGKTLAEAWATCERADWMLWLLAKTADRKLVVRLACMCARTALKNVPKGEDRPLKAIEVAEAWTRGEATIEQVRTAAAAAAASAAYASDASDATFYAANAAVAAADAYDDADRKRILDLCANIVRKHYPNPPRIRKEQR